MFDKTHSEANMKKINLFLLFTLILLTGCKKEVYLQPVPCVAECEPCFVGTKETCPETDTMTERHVFLIEDVEKPTVDYTHLENGNLKRCKHRCRQEKIKN